MRSATNRPLHIARGTELHLRGILRESFTPTISEAMAASQVILRPTVSRPVCLGVRQPSRTRGQFVLLLYLIVFIQ
jgi:hypothetical protein